MRIYSFSIRSLCKLLYPRATLRLRGTIFGSLGRSWGHFGGSGGSLEELLGGLGVVLVSPSDSFMIRYSKPNLKF